MGYAGSWQTACRLPQEISTADGEKCLELHSDERRKSRSRSTILDDRARRERRLDAWPWTAISTMVALLLGLLSIFFGYWLPHVRERQRRRSAALELRYEYFWRRDLGRMQERIVIKRHGPHVARNINVTRMESVRGTQLDLASATVHRRVLPARELHAGQELDILVEWTLADPTPGEASAEWTDDDGTHVDRFVLSPRHL